MVVGVAGEYGRSCKTWWLELRSVVVGVAEDGGWSCRARSLELQSKIVGVAEHGGWNSGRMWSEVQRNVVGVGKHGRDCTRPAEVSAKKHTRYYQANTYALTECQESPTRIRAVKAQGISQKLSELTESCRRHI